MRHRAPLGALSALPRCAGLLGGAVLLFLRLPIAVVVPMSFSSASSLEFPPPGFSLRWYHSLFGDARRLRAAGTSALVAFASSLAALVLGSIAAYGLVRGSFRGRALLEGNFIAPLILPPVITAVALYIFFARIGLLGTLAGLIVAHTVLTVPYVVLLMTVAIRAFDVRIEQVAYSLGASWWRMFRSGLLPNLPTLFAAWIFAFIISFDEVIVTLFLAGAYDTIPKRMFNELILQVNPTITAIATLLIALSVVTIALVAWLTRPRRWSSGARWGDWPSAHRGDDPAGLEVRAPRDDGYFPYPIARRASKRRQMTGRTRSWRVVGIVLAAALAALGGRGRDHAEDRAAGRPQDPRHGVHYREHHQQPRLHDLRHAVLAGRNLEPQPQMVGSYEAARTACSGHSLRDGLRFHDGSPVEGEDAAASIKR